MRVEKKVAPLLFGLISAALLSSSACTGSQRSAHQLEDTGEPALHAVHGKRLRTLMRRLDGLMFERQRTQVQIDRDRRAYLKATVEISQELLRTIPDIVSSAEDLTAEDEAAYTALAAKLEAQVKTMAALAADGRAEVLPHQYDAIVITCNACHSSFRELAGETQ